ncbi:6-phosphofructo-2-kinase/fructose-2,6-biphosphatase [Trachymyrmex septentrionalis]|uniref:6-phosphofructo-2-kinase/fructose-2, 6-biphosphatase n=1 Tax=Trachymyrmex septentrionalis TaxID=34720 RepID=A0A195FT05_9HYME|nr:PREDICTED: 6-phosphofructo-2-kinase/fructose-2,6-bisphosphatase-like [Trachymyrmex septentrionalis]KYN43725.1 6-phosphofructo-2-kinase/fructose-2,6-biphosphatase [Trachymyrmex septentrionalis]
MPWVAACFDLLATPLLGYCLAVRKLALQAGLLQEKKNDLAVRQTSNTGTSLNADTTTIMAPNAEEQRQDSGKEKVAARISGLSSKSSHKFAGVVIATCGLPARGKSQIGQSLARRLIWNGVTTKVFRVSDYRRKRFEPHISQELFRLDNAANNALIALAQRDTMQDCAAWLASGNTVAILDAMLITRTQRTEIYDYFSGQLGYRVLFIECVCDDPEVLEYNQQEIVRHCADYIGVDTALAAEDLRSKIAFYAGMYEPMNDRTYPRIKINTATMDIETCKVSGHIETSVLGYLGDISLKPHTLYFSRHGESEYNVVGKIGGDAVLSTRGERYAQALSNKFNAMRIPDLRILTSRLRRTIATVRGIEAPREHIAALNELHAGVCEGLSYEEMQERYPQEFAWRDQDKLRYRYPWGESYIDAMLRVEPVIAELQCSNNVLVVSHQAILRCIIGFFLDKKPEELPYMEVPLHTIIRITSQGYNYKLEFFKLPIECVNTTRVKPQNCSGDRTAADALITVPAHFDIPDPWRNPGNGLTLVQQH